jgi:class 3 adenylate cyclase/pimeloyl-ACP methyl ester carboxylesterase
VVKRFVMPETSLAMASRIQYARSGDVHIAYRTLGTGPIDLVVVPQWFSNVEMERDVVPLARFDDRLASFGRVILFDKRGVGLSDPVPTTAFPPIEEWMDDLRVVMDAVGSERAAIIASMAGGFMATVFAATYPDRTTALVLVDAFPRVVRTTDYPWGADAEELAAQLRAIEAGWGEGTMLGLFAPELTDDVALHASWARYERHSVSPGTALAMVPMMAEIDIRPVLPAIRVPTLAIAREQGPIPAEHGRYLADHIRGARYAHLPGRNNLIWSGDQEAVIGEIQQFITGVRPTPEPERVLATIMFTDIVGSTDLAAAIGDARWRDLLAEHNRIVRDHLDRFRGREVKTTGDGFLATFDGPARAIRCGEAISAAVHDLDISVRAGIHTGEVERTDHDLGGIAVHIGARVSASAAADEILVSSTVKDLVVGSGITFEDRGPHALKGVPGQWQLFAVVPG